MQQHSLMSAQYLIKYNLWERNSSSPSAPLCKQDLLFASSAKTLSCDQKKRCQSYLLYYGLHPDCDQQGRRWGAHCSTPAAVFPSSTWSVTQGRCAATAGVGAGTPEPCRSAQAWRMGHWTAISILGGRSQARTLKIQPESGETQQQLI